MSKYLNKYGISFMFWKWEVMFGWERGKGFTTVSDTHDARLFGFGVGWSK